VALSQPESFLPVLIPSFVRGSFSQTHSFLAASSSPGLPSSVAIKQHPSFIPNKFNALDLPVHLRWNAIRSRSTGKERDSESGLDYFGARYYGSGLGRFTSPDPAGIFVADLSNPQSWNLYSYVWNNPLANIDPSGMSCQKTDDGGSVDDNDGKGCAAAGVKPGKADDPSTLNQGQINAQATAKNPSDLEYAWTISTNQIPRYDPNDVPLNDNAKRIFTRLGNILPTVCGGGAYVYAGKTVDLGAVHGFAGAITEFDSREGVSKGALFEGGAGEGVEGGGGYVATINSKGQAAGSYIGFLGAGAHAGVASASGGLVGFSTGGGGVYAEGSLFGRGLGVGAYANVTSNAACEASHK
jgi:RHS repeat-associated protein